MAEAVRVGDCVRVPDGRIGRVREKQRGQLKIRVRRRTSKTHQFVLLAKDDVAAVECPEGWMSPDGYRRYMRAIEAGREKRGNGAKR